MKASLQPGLRYEHRFKVPPSKTVPALYPESEEFVAMPEIPRASRALRHQQGEVRCQGEIQGGRGIS